MVALGGPVAGRSGAAPLGQSPDSEVVPPEPIRCWRRTTASAVRVGEHFTLVVTCALLNTESTIVVADESKLDPANVPVAPFEVLATRRASNIGSGGHRFLQFEYDLRLIDEGLFGQDVSLPEIPLDYRVQTRVESGALSEGIAQVYLLPAQSVRVLSLVPGDTSEIRDASERTFLELDAASLRASALVTSGGVLIGLAGIVAAVAVFRSRSGARTKQAMPFKLADRAVLQGIRRELASVRQEREASGWTPELAGRALSALRVAGNYVLDRPTHQREIDPDTEGDEGTLVVLQRFGSRRTLVSAPVTAQRVSTVLAHVSRKAGGAERDQRLRDLETALQHLTQARYGRSDRDVHELDGPLDESLASGQRLVDALLREHHWIARSIKRLSSRTKKRRRRLWRS